MFCRCCTTYPPLPRNLHCSPYVPEQSEHELNICSRLVLTYRRVYRVVLLEAFVCCLVCFARHRVYDAVQTVFTPFPVSLLFYGTVCDSFPCTVHSLTDLCRPPYCSSPYMDSIAADEKDFLCMIVELYLSYGSLYVDTSSE